MTQELALSVRDLRLNFGSHEAVKGISFDIHAGETLAVVGESGSGKSASALAIMRLIEREGGRITGGVVRLHGEDPVTLTELSDARMQAIRGKRISMVFQEPMTSLNPVMTIGSQICEVLTRHQGLTRRAARSAAQEAMARVRIPEPARRMGQYPHELSGGLRQRVMIAMALACRPDLLIADEPSTALDVTTQAEILKLIKELQAEIGMAVLFITHDMGVVAEMADRVLVLRHGEMIETASVEALFEAPRAAYSKELIAATPKLGAGSPAPLHGAAPVLKVEDLRTVFKQHSGMFEAPKPDIEAVKGVSLELARGETLAIVGESGCGKSTLARSILRLIEPASGRIWLNGEEFSALGPEALRKARAQTQMIFQDPFASLNPRLSVGDLISEPAYIHHGLPRAERRELAASLLEKVRMEPEAIDRFPHQFSGGQRQRICIARALSVKPAVIIADEAVSALDVSVAKRVTDLIAELQASDGVSFLFISHDIAVVERVSHRIAVMYRGEVVETGATQDVLRQPQDSYTRKLMGAVLRAQPRKRAADPALARA